MVAVESAPPSVTTFPILVYRMSFRPERRIEFINDAIEALSGYSPADIYQDAGLMDRIVHEADLPEWRAACAEPATPTVTRVRLVRSDGQMIWTEHRLRPLFDAGNRVAAIEGVAIDIPPPGDSETKLREVARRLTEAQRIAKIGNWEWNITENHLWWSDEIYRIFGLDREEFGESYEAFLDLVHTDDRDMVDQAVDDALTRGMDYSIVHRIVLTDGTEKTVHEQAEVTFDSNGAATRMAGTVHDITQRRAAEMALRTSESRMRALLDAMPDMIFRIGRDGTFLGFHGPEGEALALPKDEFLGRRIGDIFPPDHADRAMKFLRRALETRRTQTFDYELELGGERRCFEARYVSSADDEAVAVVRDTTEQKRALEEIEALKERLLQENVRLRRDARGTRAFDSVIGRSPRMEEAIELARSVAPTDIPVLVLGETGTGKELFARALHQLSGRGDAPLVSVNCAALPADIFESELFGHEKGAFTGAYSRHIGRFEAADGGTLFLDEIGDLPLELQGKLLRVLQESEFERVGGSEPIRVDVRLIAATNRDLKKRVDEGRFRADLFYRVGNFPIVLPPLRERTGDIAVLAEHFVRKHAELMRKEVNTLSPALLDYLEAADWPGNVRELEGCVIRLILTATGPTLNLPDGEGLTVPGSGPTNGAAGSGADTALEDVQRRHILAVLEESQWVITGQNGAARLLGLAPSTLRSKMVRLGIERP